MMGPPDSGIVSDIYHLARRLYYESKKRGEQNDQMLLMMGGCPTVMGATMSLRAFNRMHGKGPKGGRGR